MKIITAQQENTVEYAAYELKKYIMELSRGEINCRIIFVDTLPAKAEQGSILLGILEELKLDTSDLQDSFVEDIIDINISNGTGYIAGSNPRSILMGVYKYCVSAGCSFMRPGADGEYVPYTDVKNHSFRYRKKADYPFRGQCCEGAISYEHMRDTIYWLPKIGMNMYMIEGMIPYGYMDRWYRHMGNPKMYARGKSIDEATIERYIRLLEQDIKKAGVQLHTLGHNWMFKKLGVGSGPMEEQLAQLRDEDRKYLALIKGKRTFHAGSSGYTHFCYSNPEGRKLLVDTLVEYLQEKPYIDFVHVWLADGRNNQCECEECVKMHPSDHYVRLLNDVDEALEKKNIKTRIVFIGYVETERPPQKLKLKRPERFVLLSAIGLHYEKGYRQIHEAPLAKIPEYVRNDWHPAPDTVRLKWHKDWKAYCGNMLNFVFEYRFYTDMYCDLGNMQISRETYRDMKDLELVGFEGCMSDQTHRMYMPTALPLITMAETLFDSSVEFDAMADQYFMGAFGEDGKLCREYLEKLSVLLCPSNFRVGGESGVEEAGLGDMETQKKCWLYNAEVAEKAAQIPEVLEDFIEVIDKNISLSIEPARLLSWRYMKYHSKICGYFAAILLAGATGGIEKAVEAYYPLEEYITEHELEFHNAFDVMLYLRTLKLKLSLPQED